MRDTATLVELLEIERRWYTDYANGLSVIGSRTYDTERHIERIDNLLRFYREEASRGTA